MRTCVRPPAQGRVAACAVAPLAPDLDHAQGQKLLDVAIPVRVDELGLRLVEAGHDDDKDHVASLYATQPIKVSITSVIESGMV